MVSLSNNRYPSASAITELLKPITWFPPMWAFSCGVVASGVSILDHWRIVLVGIILAGPLVCATSQAVNDWFDREVDAINEPQRPIPSGRMPGRWGLAVAVIWTVFSLAVALLLGTWGFLAAALGLALAWAYSAPPLALETEWLVGQCGLRFVLRGPCVDHRCCSDGWRRNARFALAHAGASVQRGGARHHDPQRLQGHQG